jgi:4-hydroxyphenylpyruvate dioxygenase-like putative hemolysin
MAGAVDALLARIGSGFFQQAFVVADLDSAMVAFTEHAGCEHWTTFPAVGTPYRYRGRDIESSVALAFSRSGRVQIELLHPIDGEGLTHDFLAEYGPGAHHIGFLVEDAAAAVAAAEADGIEAVMSGHIGTLHFVYLDTFAELGVYVEVIEDPDGLIAQLTP